MKTKKLASLLLSTVLILGSTAYAAARGATLQLGSLGDRSLEAVFQEKQAGEILDLEIKTPDREVTAHGLTGTALHMLYTAESNGVSQDHLVINRQKAPDTQRVVDTMIAEGKFMATIDHSGYTPESMTWVLGTAHKTLTYTDSAGALVSLHFERSDGLVPYQQELVIKQEALNLNGKRFRLTDMKTGQDRFYMMDLYLGGINEVETTAVTIDYQNGSREQVLEVAQNLKLHNEPANRLSTVNQDFFAGLGLDTLRANAAGIAGAVQAYQMKKDVTGTAQTVWEKNGVSVGRYDGAGRHIAIASSEAFSKNSALYPYKDHTILPDQNWFPTNKLSGLSVMYEGSDPVWAGYGSDNGRYGFGSVPAINGYAITPLDAILSNLDSNAPIQFKKVIDPVSDAPIVVAVAGDLAYIYSAVRAGDSFLVQTLHMPKTEVPADLLGS